MYSCHVCLGCPQSKAQHLQHMQGLIAKAAGDVAGHAHGSAEDLLLAAIRAQPKVLLLLFSFFFFGITQRPWTLSCFTGGRVAVLFKGLAPTAVRASRALAGYCHFGEPQRVQATLCQRASS